MMLKLDIYPGKLSLKQLRAVNEKDHLISLNQSAIANIKRSQKIVEKVIKQDKSVYGINTGFGMLANIKIPNESLNELQKKIILSHCTGVGEFATDNTVRLTMVLKINALSLGFSGIRVQVIEALIKLLNCKVYPCIPQQGSVGASGDLAPLAHMSSLLLGYGQARYNGTIISAKEALSIAQLEPIVLGPKEGLALINGTQFSCALALQGLFFAENLFANATVIGSLSNEALHGSRSQFDERLQKAKGELSQIDTAIIFRSLLEKSSQIGKSHINCEKVQDPYSLRAQPQVLGACLLQIRNSANTLLVQANGANDNPLIFSDENGEESIISGGNFHAQSIGFVSDNLALAVCEMGSISERRIALFMDKNLSLLPPFLVKNSGLNSGFMMAQVTAAALVSENKALAHPASIDSIPTSANQEDHVSMATYAARRLTQMYYNAANILGIEALCAAQGVDFRAPNKTTNKLEEVKKILRDVVPFCDEDRYMYEDIKKARGVIISNIYNKFIPKGILPSF